MRPSSAAAFSIAALISSGSRIVIEAIRRSYCVLHPPTICAFNPLNGPPIERPSMATTKVLEAARSPKFREPLCR